MKKMFFLCLLFFALPVHALELSAPEKVPSGSSFAMLAEISETNFDEINVYFDDTLVFSQSLSANPNLQYIASYIPYDPSSHKKLVLVFRPLSEGTYSIKVQLLKASNTVAEKQLSLSVFTPVESTSIQSLSHSVDIANENVRILKEKNNELSKDIGSLKKILSELKSELSSVRAGFEGVKGNINKNSEAYATLQGSLNRFQGLLSTASIRISTLSRDANRKYHDLNAALSLLSARVNHLEKQQSRVTTGFVTLGQSVAVASVAILVILSLALVLRKRRSMQESLFESGEEKNATYKDERSVMVDDILASQSEGSSRGKWAYKGAAEGRPKEEKRFSLGDLIKRS